MDQTVREIEAQIDRSRSRLGSNLQELEERVDAATDWREQFRARPLVVLGAACVAGVIVGRAFGSRTRRQGFTRHVEAHASGPSWSRVDAEAQVLDLWDNIKGALLGVAAARVKGYIGELVPGFEEQYRHTEKRRSPRSA